MALGKEGAISITVQEPSTLGSASAALAISHGPCSVQLPMSKEPHVFIPDSCQSLENNLFLPSSQSLKAKLGGWEHTSKEGNLPTLSLSLLLFL